jgi:hypothetical protein
MAKTGKGEIPDPEIKKIDPITAFLDERVKAGKIDQTAASGIILTRSKKLTKKDASLSGLKIADMASAKQLKLLELIAIKLGLAGDDGVML